MTERTNEEWIADLRAEGPRRAGALEDLRIRLEQGLFYYLHGDRSDLSDRSAVDLQQMAQDFAQDALLKILDNLDSFRGESKFTTWASKIAARVAISELRRARYKSFSLEHLTASGDILPAITAPSGAPDGGPAPEHFVERQEVLRIVEAAFRAVLTERQQTALRAVVIEGMPVEEVARQMGSNRNALYKLIHDARLKLKRHMEAQGLSLEYILELFEGT